jgi:toxin FitB
MLTLPLMTASSSRSSMRPQVTIAVDASVAVPLLIRSHHDHGGVMRWLEGQEVALSGHALADTYSVLVRLPGDARLAPADAARLLEARFATPFILSTSLARNMPDTLSRLGIAGGAVYDALVADRQGARD